MHAIHQIFQRKPGGGEWSILAVIPSLLWEHFQSLLPENADQSTFQRLTQKGKWFFDLYFLCNNWLVFIIGLIGSVNVILFLSSETEKVQFAPLKMPDTGAVSFVLLKTKISPLCSSFRTLFLYYGDFRIVFVLRTVVYVLSSLSRLILEGVFLRAWFVRNWLSLLSFSLPQTKTNFTCLWCWIIPPCDRWPSSFSRTR